MSANVALSESFDQWRVKTNELMIMTQTDGSSNFVKLTNTTNSTSNTTGSIISAGGAGFAKSMVVGENVNVHGNLHANGNITSDGDWTLGSADSDTITINGGTTGGQIGDYLELVDIATDQWHVRGVMRCLAGVDPGTCFSATVS